MSKFRNDNDNLKAHIQTLRGVMVGLFIVIGGLWAGWHHAKEETTTHIPPDLRSGAIVKPNNPGPEHIYAFALMVLQALNRWATDGAQDYGRVIFEMAPYLTPRFAEQLQADLQRRIVNPIDGTGTSVDELTGRVRSMQLIPGHGYQEKQIVPHGNDTWTALLDVHIEESVNGMSVKSINVRYPVRVIRYDVDRFKNPWGLALDGYDKPGASRLVEEHTP